MKKISIVLAAFSIGVATNAMAQTKPDTTKGQPAAIQKCVGLKGAELEKCQREAAPGKSEDAKSRADGKSPGGSGDAASRTGSAPGYGGTTDKGKK